MSLIILIRKMFVKKIEIPIFNQDVNLICGDFQESIEYLSRLHGKDIILMNNINGVVYNIDGQIYLILDASCIPLSTIVHESGHATFELMNIVGLNIDDQEAFCYIQTFIFQEILCILSIPTDPINLLSNLEDMEQS